MQAPEEIIPGRPLFFASAVPIDGFACGVLVKSEMGRPIKIEGNPAHPASLGATDIFGQAALLGLYDPDRSRTDHARRTDRDLGAFPDAWRWTSENRCARRKAPACES